VIPAGRVVIGARVSIRWWRRRVVSTVLRGQCRILERAAGSWQTLGGLLPWPPGPGLESSQGRFFGWM